MSKYLLLLTYVLVLGSCIPQKKLEYRSISDNISESVKINLPRDLVIKQDDQLLIEVTSFDDISFNYFEQASTAMNTGANEMSLSTVAYNVDEEGCINFPILGDFKVAGLTKDEATAKLAKALESYFNQPNVSIRFAFKHITILGEVNNPGRHLYTTEQLTIFEALGLANDLTIHGNRRNVYLIRQNGETMRKYHVDLTDGKNVFSSLYYLQPGDIIYIKPNKSIKWGTISTPVSIVFSAIASTIAVISFIQNQ